MQSFSISLHLRFVVLFTEVGTSYYAIVVKLDGLAHIRLLGFSPYRMSRQPSPQTLAEGGPTTPMAMIEKVKAEGELIKYGA
jgi:hypothetical protein